MWVLITCNYILYYFLVITLSNALVLFFVDDDDDERLLRRLEYPIGSARLNQASNEVQEIEDW